MKRSLCGLAIVLSLFAIACEPRRPDEAVAKRDVENIAFVRHSNGLCFGVVRFPTYGGYMGVSIVAVPTSACAP